MLCAMVKRFRTGCAKDACNFWFGVRRRMDTANAKRGESLQCATNVDVNLISSIKKKSCELLQGW